MADKTVKVDIIASDKGTLDPLIKKSEVLKANLNDASRGSSGRVPMPVANARGALSGGREAADFSNQARSLGPGTGAAGRDFAKQSRGLGGLVQIYATFAANIFAASAAFTALSKAADLDNLKKGLDQLGAASGKNLGSLAKDLQVATDGAISLEDALRATANASAGGLAAKDILRLGNVARQASQALGVSMPDAISRLTRGITKLEPELLDEIGIMVRLDDATRKYATSMGKTALSLTDFERRQAFANAVLEQGEKKFGAIELTVNPYSKLLASIQTLSVQVGSAINAVLGPLLDILNSSPVALALAIGGLATLLLRQAVPALTSWKQGLAEAEAAARKTAIETARARSAAAAAFKVRQQDDPVQKYVDQLKRSTTEGVAALEKLKTATNRAVSPGTKALLPKDLDSVTKKTIDDLEKRAKVREAASRRATTPVGSARAALEAESIRELNRQLYANLEARTRLDKFESENARNSFLAKKINRLKEYLSLEQQQTRIADRQAAKSQRLSIVNAAVQEAPVKGSVQAFKDLNANIALARAGKGIDGIPFEEGTKKMTAFNAGLTRVSGGLRIAASAASTLLASLASLFFYVGIAIAAFQILNKWFSSSAKESEKFKTAIDGVESSVENIGATLDNISKKELVNQSSIDSTVALSNALSSLSSSVETSVMAFEKLQAAQSVWDDIIDGIIDFLPFIDSASEKLSKGIGEAVANSFSTLQNPELRKKAKEQLEGILGVKVDLNNAEQIQDLLNDLSNSELAAKGKAISAALKDIDNESKKVASNLTSVKDTLKVLSDDIKANNAKLTPNDPFSKIGISAVAFGRSVTEAFKDPIDALNTLKETSKDLEGLSLLPPGTAKNLALSSKDLDNLSAKLSEVRNKMKEAEEAEAKASGKIAKAEAGRAVINLRSQEASVIASISNKIKEFASVGTQFVQKGNAMLLEGLTNSLREASLAINSGISSIAKSLGVDTTKQDLSNIREEANIQRRQIEAQFENTNALVELTLAVEESNIRAKQAELIAKEGRRTPAENEALAATSTTIKALDLAKATIRSGAGVQTTARLSESGDPVQVEASKILQDWMQKNAGRTAQLAKISAGVIVKELQNSLDAISIKFKNQIEEINRKNPALDAQLDQAKQGVSLVGEYDEILASKVRELEVSKGINNLTADQLSLVSKYAQLQAVIDSNSTSSLLRAEALVEQQDIQNQLLEKATVYQQKLANDEQAFLQARLQGLQALQDAEDARALTTLELGNNSASAELDLIMARLDAENSLNRVAADTLAINKAAIDTRREDIALSTTIARIETNRSKAVGALEAKRSSTDVGSAEYKNLTKQIERANKEYGEQLGYELQMSAVRKGSIAITKQQALEQDVLNQKLADQAKIIESLEGAFGDFGAAIGSVTQVLFDFAENSKNLAAQEANALKNTSTEDERVKVEQEYYEKRKELELDYNIEALSATKKLFKEKTGAYRALNAVEKAFHTYRLVMLAKQQTEEAIATAKSIAGSIKAMIVKGGEATIQQATEGDPWTAFARMAAMATAVASLIASVGGSGGPKVSSGGYSAADRQETQGTGMSWVNSKKVENGGGVFGDSEAKSESISNSLELLNANFIKGLGYSNRMVMLLESINASIGDASKTLYSIPGIRTGSLFGTVEGSKTKGITGLFGSTTTKNIEDAGIRIQGTFLDLINNATAALDVYETVKSTKKSSGFLGIGSSTKTTIKTKYADLDASIANELSAVFDNAADLFIETGARLGMSVADVYGNLAKINIDQLASLRGLKGEDLEKELNAIIGNILDTAANGLFKNMEQYREFGEGMLETAIRIIDTNDKINSALYSIGIQALNTSDVLTDSSIAISESMAEISGGLTEFVSKVQFFRDNFLTASEQLAPIKENLQKNLGKLGFDASLLDTREEFASVVQAIDLTTESGRVLFDNMMDIAEAFSMVYPETRKMLSAESLREAQIKQIISVLRLEGRASEALAMQRKEELASLDAALVPGQEYIWQLEDRLDLIKREGDVISALGFTYEGLTISRELELRSLTDQQRVLTELVFATQDAAKTQELYVRLLTASGQVQEATTMQRQKELNALSDSDAALLSRIYLLEDEKALLDKRADQEKTIYELVGKAEEALAITREKEIAALDEKLVPSQLYIYALQDEASLKEQLVASYENEGSSLRDVISRTKSFIATLKDARDALLLGDLSVLTPAEKYEEAKRQAQEVAAIATGIATTDAEKEAKNAAIEKLPTVTSQFLEASRTLYASSSAYTQDFDYVFSILENTGTALEKQLSEAEQQLAVLETNTSILSLIDTSTKTTAQLLAELVPVQLRVAETQMAAAAAGSAAAGGNSTNFVLEQLIKESLPYFAETMFNSAMEALSSPTLGFEAPDLNIQELIVTNNNNTQELVAQLKVIEAQLESLRKEQAEQTGHVVEAVVISGNTVTGAVTETATPKAGDIKYDFFTRDSYPVYIGA